MVQVDLRKPPIQGLPIGKRKVVGPRDTSQTVHESGVIRSGIRISDKSVNAVSCALGFGFHLQRIVVGQPGIENILDGRKWESGIRYTERCATRSASQRISSSTARARRSYVDVSPVFQNVGAASPRVAHRQHDLPRQLVFHIDVELLNSALLEVGVLRQNCARKAGGRRGCGEYGESRRHADSQRRYPGFRAGRRRKGAVGGEEGKGIRFGVVGRILPQPLRSHVPRRIVIDRIAAADHSIAVAERFPRRADPRLQRGPIHVDARPRARILARDQELAIGGIKISLAIAHFGLRSQHRPGQTEVQGQTLTDTPIVLNEGAIQLPTAARITATKLRVVDGQARQTCQQVRLRIPSPASGGFPKSVRKANGHGIQLVPANGAAHSEFVTTPNHVQGVGEHPNIRPAHERRITAISQRIITT